MSGSPENFLAWLELIVKMILVFVAMLVTALSIHDAACDCNKGGNHGTSEKNVS